jgi:hypothetical protein
VTSAATDLSVDARSYGRRRVGRPLDGVDAWVAAGPLPQRWGMRALLTLAGRPRGAALLGRLGPVSQLAGSILAMRRYDDPARSRALGWDAEAVVARGRELRRVEGRP